MRAPFIVAAVMIASITQPSSPADAQVRVARPRAVASRPVVISRPTVFVGGYYYPTFYRSSLWYDPWGPGFYGGYGRPYYQIQIPIYGRGRGYGQASSVRVQVSPRQAEVFVDGYFAGTVDDFDGVFQRLDIAPGEHEIQIYLAGYRPHTERFYLQPGKSFNIRHTLEPLAAGEPMPPRPGGVTPPGAGQYDPGRGGPSPPDGQGTGRGRGGAARGRGPGPGTAEGFGSLSLRVQPADAEVRIDGEVWQRSLDNEPLVVQLGAGTHNIEIRKDGYRNYLTDVSIVNGQVRTLNVALNKQ